MIFVHGNLAGKQNQKRGNQRGISHALFLLELVRSNLANRRSLVPYRLPCYNRNHVTCIISHRKQKNKDLGPQIVFVISSRLY